MWGRLSEDNQVRLAQSMAAFWRYAEALVASRAERPCDDFTSDLLLARANDLAILSHQEVTQIVYELLFAGHETTTGLIGNAMRQLLTEHHAWEELCRDAALIPNAVEEVLRFDSSVIAWRRKTTQAVNVGDVPVPAGANLLLLLQPSRFPPGPSKRRCWSRSKPETPVSMCGRRHPARSFAGFGSGSVASITTRRRTN